MRKLNKQNMEQLTGGAGGTSCFIKGFLVVGAWSLSFFGPSISECLNS